MQQAAQRVVADAAGQGHPAAGCAEKSGQADRGVGRAAADGQRGLLDEAIAAGRRQLVHRGQHQVAADKTSREHVHHLTSGSAPL
jgi:hypothetical protein